MPVACFLLVVSLPHIATTACDPVVEEHFRRSLGKNYKEPEPVTNSVSITGSVDDHFAKALGDTWLQIKAAKDGVSSSPESASRRGQSSSPSSHMVNHNHSPSIVSWRKDHKFAWFDWAWNRAQNEIVFGKGGQGVISFQHTFWCICLVFYTSVP